MTLCRLLMAIQSLYSWPFSGYSWPLRGYLWSSRGYSGQSRASTHGHQELLPAHVAAAWRQLLPARQRPGAASGLAQGATSQPLPARGSRSDRSAAKVCQWGKLPFPEAVGPGWELLPLPGGAGGSSPLGRVLGAARAPQGQDRARRELVLPPLAPRSARPCPSVWIFPGCA